jgi:FkbM family methyltransferase
MKGVDYLHPLRNSKRTAVELYSYFLKKQNSFKPYISFKEKIKWQTYPRKKEGSSIFLGNKIFFPDAYWYLYSIQELFIDQVYKFSPRNDHPFIIDCGSNIGLSIIYFKKHYPDCKIIGFEADPKIFELCEQNIGAFGYETGIQLIKKAVWINDGFIEFLSEGTLGGSLERVNEKSGSQVLKIACTRLNNYLNQPVDFLKLDIEGSELTVLKDCAENLKNVDNLFVEFHGYTDKEQNLDELLILIKQAGFRYYIKESFPNLTLPFVEKVPNNNFDILLNIFCYRV